MLMILAQYILYTILSLPSQYRLGVRLYFCIFEIVVPTPNPWNDRGPLTTYVYVFFPHSLLQRSLPFCFWLSSAVMLVFSRVFPFFIHCCFCIWHFQYFSHSFSCNMILMVLVKKSFHACPRRIVGLNNSSVFCLALLFKAKVFPVSRWIFARNRGCHRNFQLSTCILHDIFKNFHHQDLWSKLHTHVIFWNCQASVFP